MLTKTQNSVLEYLRKFFSQHGYAPTIAEIATAIGIKSRGVVHRYLQEIAESGLIEIIPGKKRNIKIIDEHAGCLPLVGRIAAGEPIDAIEHVQWLNISDALLGGNRYLLKVKGTSMIEENICDGDLVICEKVNAAYNGQIVVALIDQREATLKRIKHNPDRSVTLIPANATLQPRTYKGDRVQIQGVYIGLLRLA